MPIRRYPDLVVHRDLAEVAEDCSQREREAADVEYTADELCLAWLLERRLFELGWEAAFSGEIIGIIESGPCDS